ncbi:alginate lyase family protein [Mesorhizobium sp. KR1-2]|uniref:heparinase II/III family protein n=1 Tax=Mesorhizobium sp. KR1-2 TaxID=3156609 RepID=UPI0032B50045
MRRGQSQIGPDEFRFLNEVRSLSQHGWDDPAVAKLWRYNLHYFDDLNAEGAEHRTDWHRALIARWIAQNPPGKGTGWEPYPTSLRIVNWIKWARAGNPLSSEVVTSLAVQARWLARRLEHHLLGNHLFANAKALVFAGCFFAGEEAGAWLDLGLGILAREVPEQILEDGGHFELSTMYHALALEDMLDLVNVLRAVGLSIPDLWERKIAAMRSWLAAMSHPDGEIAFFNDAALGIAPLPWELEDYAERLGFAPTAAVSSLWLRDSGYVRLGDDRAVALLDVGRIGPDYLPGHAHADTLSFELSVDGRRAIVNSGTSVYGKGPERLRQRGTAGHNTVEIDGENSSEIWSGFRVARRARPEGLFVSLQDQFSIVACSHDGYRRLSGQPRHRRSWYFGGDSLIVSDKVEGGHDRAVAAFHFHPAFTPSATADGSTGSLCNAHGTVLRWSVAKGTARIEPSTWHPEFGASLPARRLLLELSAGKSVIEFSWAEKA